MLSPLMQDPEGPLFTMGPDHQEMILTSERPVEGPGQLGKAAVFLDRDGTLIEENERVEWPEQVVLLPGVAEAIRRLRSAGYRAIVVTNQSAIARGLLDEARLARVHAGLRSRLSTLGAGLDDIYFCPDAPDAQAEKDLPFALRKPGAGMLLRAAEEHGLVLSRCWMIGDQLRDVIAGRRAGCRGNLLVRTGRAPLPPAEASEKADGIFDDLSAAVQFVLSGQGPASRPEAARRPRPHPR